MDAEKHERQEIVVQATQTGPLRPAGYVNAYPGGNGGYVHEEMDDAAGGGLLEYWQILMRRKGTVLLIAFAGLAAAILYTLPQTPVYQARASLEVQTMRENTSLHDPNGGMEASSYDVISDMQTQIKLIQSDSVLDRAIEKLKLTVPADLKPPQSRIAAWRKALNIPEAAPKNAREALLDAAAASVKARAAGQTRVVEVTADSTDPKIAAAMANAVANEFIDANIEARWKMTQRTAEWLSKQLEEMKIKLEKSEDSLQQYAREAGLVFTSDNKQNFSEEKLRQVQAELSRAQADRVSKQSRYETARNSSPEALPDVLNDSSLREYQTKLTDLRRQEAELSETYKPEFSKVKRVRAQIKTVEAALERERKAIIDRIKNDYDEALRREKLLAGDYGLQTRAVTSDAEKSIQYNILKREVDTNRQLYEAMLQRVKESSIASAMKASNVRVVDSAVPPDAPYKPRLPMNAALGLFAGGFLGIAFVVVSERMDRTLQQPGDAAFYLNVPELGVIPAGETGKRRLKYLNRSKAGDEQTTSLVPAKAFDLTGTDQNRVELATYVNKASALAESFRATLTSILFSGHNGSRPRVLVVTSANPGEGKTTVASNLAVAVAEIGHRVLLVDADLRKPRIHDIFGVDNTLGLGDLLRDRQTADDAMWNAIQQPTSAPGLSVLPSGQPTPAAANLLHSPSFRELMKRFKANFDMVLIDTPPMLQMPDARVAGRAADAVILVVRADTTTRDAAVAARQRFAEDSTRVLGTVLNDWNPSKAGGHRSYASYGRSYGAQYGSDAGHNVVS